MLAKVLLKPLAAAVAGCDGFAAREFARFYQNGSQLGESVVG